MHPRTAHPDLCLAESLPLDRAEAARVMEQAAVTVDAFVAQTAQSALEAILDSAACGDLAKAVDRARTVAHEATENNEMLDLEVTRFLALAAQDSESPDN